MTIGLISDTHGFLDPLLFEHLKNCDEIWHAGDIGDVETAEALKAFKPLKGVYGNIDGQKLQTMFPEDLWLRLDGINFLITHIAGSPPGYNPRVKKMLAKQLPDVLICGHSHILKIGRDEKHNNMLFVNPGAAGNHGFHTKKTVVRFQITEGKINNMEVIDLGKRGQLKS
jgi:putative phosphoesterase